MMRKAGGDGKDTVMATPVEVDNELSSQENKDETSLNVQNGQLDDDDVTYSNESKDHITTTTTTTENDIPQITKEKTEKEINNVGKASSSDSPVAAQAGRDNNNSLVLDQTAQQHPKLETGLDTTSLNQTTLNLQDTQKLEKSDDVAISPADSTADLLVQTDANNTGQSTPQLDGTETPPTPRSTPAKPSVFKKATSIQKIKLNETFLKTASPTSGSPTVSTPRPAPTDKLVSTVARALKPMVRNRLSNMGGTSMQRQGSGSSTSKSGRGSSPNLGRTGSGSDVWSWRRQPAQTREYTEEELQRQGVHLTARLTASSGDDHSKWADMDDDWSEEEEEEQKEETKETSEPPPQENHVEHPPIAPHLLESAALSRMQPEREEETIIVSKNDRFADVTYDRKQTRSPDENIHGQRQIYNPKLRRFEEVPSQSPRDTERGRRPVEIMQRGHGRRSSSVDRRRGSFTRSEDPRLNRGPIPDNRAYSPPSQRRPSFAEREHYGGRRRESFISTSAISDADRSMSNASPAIESQGTTESLPPIDLIVLQQKEMAESRKRAMERRARDEEERQAAAERARKKAEQLAAMTGTSTSTTTVSESPRPSPHSSRATPASIKASPVPQGVSPAPLPSRSDDSQQSRPIQRRDSNVFANRDQEEIIKKDSPIKEDTDPKRWGAIGSSQSSATPSHKHQQNGLFSNPNTLAAINSAIGGDSARRGRAGSTRGPRAPINPTNVPPSLQGWANFASNAETRRAHDDEKQAERTRERERVDREKDANNQRTTNLVDKWKRVEIKEPENAGDIAGRTVVSVLKSGYMEDLTGNLEVRDLTDSPQKPRPEETGLPKISSANAGNAPLGMRSPALGQTTPNLGMQSPTQSMDKTPSRDRSRFFPSPSTMVDMSPRVVHPIQPSPAERSPFAPGLFPSVDDASKARNVQSPSGPTSQPAFGATSQLQQGQYRQHHVPPFSQYGQPLPNSPGQLPTAPHVGGLTPRNTFSHTVPMTSPPPPQSRQAVKIPSAADFDSVMERIRQTIQDSSLQDAQTSPSKEIANPHYYETTVPTRPVIPQQPTQTRAENNSGSEVQSYLKISAISPQRDLIITTRDLDEEPAPKITVRVSLPMELHVTSREIELPIENASRPTVKFPSEYAPELNSTDVKARLEAIEKEDRRRVPQLPQQLRPPYAFKIQFMPSLQPKGGIVPNLVKKDKFGFPYINFEAKPDALTLPSYAPDSEAFYGASERQFSKPKFHKKPFTPHRKGPKHVAEGSSAGQGNKGPSRPVDKK